MSDLRKSIALHEGLSLTPYKCSEGYTTVGFGRNLDTKGISLAEAYVLLDNDIRQATIQAERFWWFDQLTEQRADVVVEMIYNLGARGFNSFQNMIKAIEQGNFEEASFQMLESKWSSQVGKRAITLSNNMRADSKGLYL